MWECIYPVTVDHRDTVEHVTLNMHVLSPHISFNPRENSARLKTVTHITVCMGICTCKNDINVYNQSAYN